MMKWDNGRSLSLIYGEDSFRILSPDEVNAERYEKKKAECWLSIVTQYLSRNSALLTPDHV